MDSSCHLITLTRWVIVFLLFYNLVYIDKVSNGFFLFNFFNNLRKWQWQLPLSSFELFIKPKHSGGFFLLIKTCTMYIILWSFQKTKRSGGPIQLSGTERVPHRTAKQAPKMTSANHQCYCYCYCSSSNHIIMNIILNFELSDNHILYKIQFSLCDNTWYGKKWTGNCPFWRLVEMTSWGSMLCQCHWQNLWGCWPPARPPRSCQCLQGPPALDVSSLKRQ